MTVQIILKAVKPSYAISKNYRIRLRKILYEMNKQVTKSVEQVYTLVPKSVEDAKPNIRLNPQTAVNEQLAQSLQDVIKQQVSKWFQFFNFTAPMLANTYAANIQNSVDMQLNKAFKDTKHKEVAQQLTTGFSNINKEALQSSKILIENNVSLIKSIPDQYFTQIQNAVTQSMLKGRDKDYLIKELKNIYHITDRRAEFIAHDQLRKATSAMDNERRLKLGITKGIWRHSHADKVPRKTHLEASGRVYDLKQGCPIKNEKGVLEYIQVGEKIGCTCWSESVVEFD